MGTVKLESAAARAQQLSVAVYSYMAAAANELIRAFGLAAAVDLRSG